MKITGHINCIILANNNANQTVDKGIIQYY